MAVYPLAAAPESKTVRPAGTSGFIAFMIRPNRSGLSFARLGATVIIPTGMNQPLPGGAIYVTGSGSIRTRRLRARRRVARWWEPGAWIRIAQKSAEAVSHVGDADVPVRDPVITGR